jgi:hypothetical protein
MIDSFSIVTLIEISVALDFLLALNELSFEGEESSILFSS